MIAIVLSAAAQAACTVISGVAVHTGDAVEQGFTVVVAGDRIAAVGASVAGAASGQWKGETCTVVDGKGKELTAGLVAVPTQIGLVEIGLEQTSRDDDPMIDDQVRAALVAVDAYDPLSTLVPIERIEGITTT